MPLGGKAAEGEWGLTRRERQVLLLVADGATSDQIAHALGLKSDTVNQHLNSTREKLGARNRIELATLAVRDHLVVADAAARPVVWEVAWSADQVASSVTPRYLGRAAIRRFPGMLSMLDRPFADWMPDWEERLAPALEPLPSLEIGSSPVEITGARIIIPDTGLEVEWSAWVEAAGKGRYLFVIYTPLPE